MQLVDLAGGNFVDVLLEAPRDSALVLFEARRYSRLAMDLAEEARRAKIPTTLVTDIYCNWGHEVADEMFVIPTEFNMFWESTAQMASFSNLMINEIFKALGPAVEKRMDEVSGLYGRFIGHVGGPADADGGLK